MWSTSLTLLIILSVLHLTTAASEFETCCRHGFEDGIRLNMLRDQNASVIRSQNFNRCEEQIAFGRESFRRCKMVGEAMALNCQIGKYHSLLNHKCDSDRMNPTTYACCITCSNGKRFAEEEFELFRNKSMEVGAELFRNEHLYGALLNQVDKDLDKQCKLLNLVSIIPELQLATFHQCCRSWTYNYNQNFYPDEYRLKDTCDRVNTCLNKQNHTKFNLDKGEGAKNLAKLKTDNLMKMIRAHLKMQNDVFEDGFDQVLLRAVNDESGNLGKAENLRSLKAVYDTQADFHKKNLRSLTDKKQFHSNISSYELALRQVPFEKFKYHHCNKMCRDAKQLDYSETYTTVSSRRAFTQCFHNYSEQFCAKPIECSAGFMPNHNNTICIKLDECAEKLDDCLPESEYCVKHFNGYTCECRDGYRYNLLSKKCVNVDECVENARICPEHSYCKDLVGSYECVCFEGLFMNDFRQCMPFLTRQLGSAPAESNGTLYLPPNQAEDEDLEEKQMLAEKMMFEKTTMDGLKKGLLVPGDPIKDGTDKITDTIANKNLTNRQSNAEEKQSTGGQVTSVESPARSDEDSLPTNNQPVENRQTNSESTMQPIERGEMQPKNEPVSEPLTEPANEQTISPKLREEPTPSPISESLAQSDKQKYLNEMLNNNKLKQPEVRPILEAVGDNPCPKGYFLSLASSRMRTCVDINECTDSALNNCTANETCINLPGTYGCQPKNECPPNYKALNVTVHTVDQHHYETSSTRASTLFCKYQHSRKFETNEQRRRYEKSNSIIQYIVFDRVSMPFNRNSDYLQVPSNAAMSRVDKGRVKNSNIAIYLVDKTTKAEQMKTDFVGSLKIRTTTCREENISRHFKLHELYSNVFAILLIEPVKEPCTIDFNLDIKSKYTTQTSEFNRELYQIQLVVHRFDLQFPIAGSLQSKCLKNDQKIC